MRTVKLSIELQSAKLQDCRTSSKAGSVMVWARSGPVEIIPIFAPDSCSIK
jgi:hypothetical protein